MAALDASPYEFTHCVNASRGASNIDSSARCSGSRLIYSNKETILSYETIDFKIENGVALITLANPKTGNAIDKASARDLMQAAVRCDKTPEIRAVLLTGEGRVFSVGGNLQAFSESGVDGIGLMVGETATYLHGAVARLAHMRAPLVVAVNGTAAGGGMSLAMLGDIVIMARSAIFNTAYTAAGLSPDGGMTFLLPRLVGLRRAQELLLTNRRISAEEALELGLVTSVVNDAELLSEARTMAERLAAGPTQAFGSVRARLLQSFSTTLEAQLEAEAQGLAISASGADGQEGINAFLAKRRPVFQGI